jgi:hypothetical protein
VTGDFDAGLNDDPLKLKVELDGSKEYCLLDPGREGQLRDGFMYRTNLTDEVEFSFSGSATARIEALVPLIGAEAKFDITIENINDVFDGDSCQRNWGRSGATC